MSFFSSSDGTGGRCSGLVVSVLDSGSRGPGLGPGRVIVLCSCVLTLTVPLSI